MRDAITTRDEARHSLLAQSHPGLSNIRALAGLSDIRPVALLPLQLLLLRVAAAVNAAGDGAEYRVMAGIVTGDAADRRALQTTLGIGGGRSQRERCDGEYNGDRLHDSSPLE